MYLSNREGFLAGVSIVQPARSAEKRLETCSLGKAADPNEGELGP